RSERCALSFRSPPTVDRIDAHELDAEVAEPLQQAVQSCLVQGAREHALAGSGLALDALEGGRDVLAQPALHDDAIRDCRTLAVRDPHVDPPRSMRGGSRPAG